MWIASPKGWSRFIASMADEEGCGRAVLHHLVIDDEPGIPGPGVGDTGTCCLASDNFPLDQVWLSSQQFPSFGQGTRAAGC